MVASQVVPEEAHPEVTRKVLTKADGGIQPLTIFTASVRNESLCRPLPAHWEWNSERAHPYVASRVFVNMQNVITPDAVFGCVNRFRQCAAEIFDSPKLRIAAKTEAGI